MDALQPGSGPIPSATYLPADPASVLWGRLPCAADAPVLTIDPGEVAASDYDRGDGGPHVVTGPIAVRGARVGDLLKMTVVETSPRVPYGIVSNRHGRGSLAREYPVASPMVSVFAGDNLGTLLLTAGASLYMPTRVDDALAGPRTETSEFLVPTGLDAEHAHAYLSVATDFTISQVVDLVESVHARIRKTDFS